MDEITEACACVTGWHFDLEFYRQLREIRGLTVFVISHRAANDIPLEVLDMIGPHRLFCVENAGYDWGAYQQFLELGLFRPYAYVFFMHDDLRVLDTRIVEECIRRLDGGARFIGNGRSGSRSNWFQRAYPAMYAHSAWIPPDRSFQHATIRGSFFATTRDTLVELRSFEVFWDRFRLSTSFGNWSLVASCGKAEALFGEGCFAWLSDTYLESPYLIEGHRGTYPEAGGSMLQSIDCKRGFSRSVFELYKKLCNFYVACRLCDRRAWIRLLRPLIMLPAGRKRSRIRGFAI